MVMEFAAGGDLFNLLTKSHPPISLHEKHCLWRQLINGVQYMHSMGVAVSCCLLFVVLVCLFFVPQLTNVLSVDCVPENKK